MDCSKTVAIVQSSYLPWKGYFDLIAASDEFVLLDSVQYTRRDWRNRNRIKTPTGFCWLTIPVYSKGLFNAPICDIQVSDPRWAQHHWATIRCNFAGAPYFKEYSEPVEALYRTIGTPWLSEINVLFLRLFCRLLKINANITSCRDYAIQAGMDATQRLVSICRQSRADTYLSGPSARTYLRSELFDQADIVVRYMDYSNYPEYSQRFGAFEHKVSIIDLLFQMGPRARNHLLCGLAESN